MNREQLQNKLHNMQRDSSYRLFTYDTEAGVKTLPALKDLSTYLILTDSEWFARNTDQQLSSRQQEQNKVLFSETSQKLFLPQADKTALYISPNHPSSSPCTFAYILLHGSKVSAGFVSEKSSDKYYTIQLPISENNCFYLMDYVMTVLARIFPEDVDKLRTFFNLGSTYSAGDESIFEE